MIQIELSASDIQELKYQRFHHPHPRVQLRMEVIWLKNQGIPHGTIASIAAVSPNTVREYLRMYIEGGIEGLKQINFYRPKSGFHEHSTSIEEYFRKHPPASIKEAAQRLYELTGIRRSPTQVCKFLKNLGMTFRKVGMIPAKADPDKQEEFREKELEPRLRDARSGRRKVYFVDAAHFVLAPFLGYLWCFTRLFLRAPSGRKRFNVLGALDAITHQLITVVNDSYINADSVCELLVRISEQCVGVPVTLVLDNARYQKCKKVHEVADSLRIELLYLPPYSPNLNLIERVWKFVKKKCLYSKYYSDFESFTESITGTLSALHTTYNYEMDSLLRLRFQTFRNTQAMAA